MTRRTHGLIRVVLLCATVCLSANLLADSPRQLGKRANGAPIDQAAVKAERKAYHDWLVSERVVAARENALVVNASEEQKRAVDSAPQQFPEIVGFSQALDVDLSFRKVNFSRLRGQPQKMVIGAIEGTADGGYVYTADISSPGATALRVQFAGFDLPAGAAMYLYTPEGQVFGPYSGRGPLGTGEFDSNTLAGDTVTLQLRQLGPASRNAMRDARFRIVGLGHIRPRIMAGTCGYNADCVQNAECGGTSSVVDPARQAVAHMVFRSGAYLYMCSGGLINDADESNNLPLFLTANHCVSKSREANSLENFFLFQAESCTDTSWCDATLNALRNEFDRTLGASIVSTGRSADYTLLRLSEQAPGGTIALAWNADPIAFTNGAPLYRISHPQGAPQSYSEHVVDTDAGTCQSWPRGDRIYSKDLYGATEGGSSGSPVLNGAGEIVGQLSGACGTNVYETCDSESNATVDGAFAAYYDEVAQYLAPGGSGCTPTETPETSCNDGQDNDCDGDTDANDSDCGSSGEPGGVGDTCQSDGDCLSNKCKGKPGAMTCR